MAFTVTWANRAFSLGPIKRQHFTYTALATDVAVTLTPPSLTDRVDYCLIDGVIRTAADVSNVATSTATASITLALQIPGSWLYSFTVTSASATIGAIYAAANGQLFTVAATIAGATTLTLNSEATGAALAASGTLTKIAGTGDNTITYSATGTPTVYGTGIAYGI